MKKVLIVGGGTAGAVVSSRLNRLCDLTVIESSSNRAIPHVYRIPLLIGLLFSKKNKFIEIENVRIGSSRSVPMYKPNVLGGASMINGCVHTSGSSAVWKELLDRFEFTLDDLYHSWDSLFSYINRKKRILLRSYKPDNIDRIFCESLNFNGVRTGDTDWVDSPVCGPTVNNVGCIARSSVLQLAPFENCKLVMGSTVTNLVLDEKKKIVGVFDGTKNHYADLVIICAGVAGTNSLMRAQTRQLNNQPSDRLQLDFKDTVKDHVNLRVNFDLSLKALSINDVRNSLPKSLILAMKHALGLSTVMQGTGATSTAYLDLNEDGVVDTKLNLLRFAEVGRSVGLREDDVPQGARFSISITPIQPESFGHLTAVGERWLFDPAYLNSRADVELLQKALAYVLMVLRTPPFGNFVENISRVAEIETDPISYIKDNIYSGFHPIGGCQSIVSKDFNVTGFDNLFVCDASILDRYVASNIHSSVAILADLCSRRVIQKYLTI